MKKHLIVSLVLCMFMVSSSVLSRIMTPTVMLAEQQTEISLDAIIPSEFGSWKIDSSIANPIVNPTVKGAIEKIYGQTLARTYINNNGERLMLSVAYGGVQNKELQVHRPEICYAANGFDISKITKAFVETTIARIPVMHLVAKQGTRNEPITYWIRVGDSLTRGWFEQKMAAIRYGLSGKVPDGILVRVSTISNDEQDSFRIQQSFLTAMLQAMRSEDRFWLVGQMTP